MRHSIYYHEICKQNYTSTIDYISSLPTDIQYIDIKTNLQFEIQNLETKQQFFNNRDRFEDYVQIFDDIKTYKNYHPNYINDLNDIQLLIFYLTQIYNKYNLFIDSLKKICSLTFVCISTTMSASLLMNLLYVCLSVSLYVLTFCF